MAYENVNHITYNLPLVDFGDGSGGAVDAMSFRLPTGYRGRLVKIGVAVTETFACDTTAACVKLGTSSDDDAYAKLNIADGTADLDFFDETDDTDAIIDEDIPADTLLKLTTAVGVDAATEAGMGHPMLVFEIYQR